MLQGRQDGLAFRLDEVGLGAGHRAGKEVEPADAGARRIHNGAVREPEAGEVLEGLRLRGIVDQEAIFQVVVPDRCGDGPVEPAGARGCGRQPVGREPALDGRGVIGIDALVVGEPDAPGRGVREFGGGAAEGELPAFRIILEGYRDGAADRNRVCGFRNRPAELPVG